MKKASLAALLPLIAVGLVSCAASDDASGAVPKERMQEEVQKVLDRAVAEGRQGAVQFCVYIDGECVVDAWAGTYATNSTRRIDGDSLFPVYSTEKQLLVTAAHRAHELGLLDYEKPVKSYWPEFTGSPEKEALTVRELMGHRAGLPSALPKDTALADRTNWNYKVAWFAKQPAKAPGRVQRYLSGSFGVYLGHVLECVCKKPVKDVLDEQAIVPAGIANDFFFISGPEEDERIVTVYNGVESGNFERMNETPFRRAIDPSGWAVASARGIAKFYNRLCGFDGAPPLIRPETLDFALRLNRCDGEPVTPEINDKWIMVWGLGYGLWGDDRDLSSVFGQGGLGGSEGMCDRKKRICIGYTCNIASNFDGFNRITGELFRIVGFKTRYTHGDRERRPMVRMPGATSAAKGIYRNGWIDFNKNNEKDVYEDPTQPVESRVADLISQMTVEEKTCQLATLYGSGRVLKDAQPTDGWLNEIWKDGIANVDEELNGVGPMYKDHPELVYSFSNHVAAVNAIQRWFVERTRLGIPVDFSNEGIHGLNHTKATPLPAPIGVGSTWNRALVREAGEIVGREAKLIGYSNVYAPILDVARDPRWGRTLECYGEDPYLVGSLGVEMVRGLQSQGVASTLKHYAVYSVPKGGRDADCRTDPHVTPRDLHEIFLAPFRRVVCEAHPLGAMCSYNDWNGEPVAASRHFLTDILRNEYGFDGYVVSDSEAVEFVHTKHAVAETYAEACVQVLKAGLNVRTHFSPPKDFILPVREMIAAGRLPMSVVDRRVSEVLSVKFRLGLFDNPYLGDVARADAEAGLAHRLDFADRIQSESFVLLKNGGILPLDVAKVKRVLVTGPLAAEANYMTSRYGPNGNPVVTVLDGLRDYLKGTAEVVYAKGCETVDADWPDSEIVPRPLTAKESAAMDAAVGCAGDVDVIVAVLGEDERCCGESRSRTSLDLPGRQQQFLERLQATGKPVVLVLVNGQPLTVNWADRNVAAILETWFPGPRGGVQIAKTLFGELNPSGRLTVTFPKSIGQIECNFPFKKGSHGGQDRSGGPNGSGATRVIGSLYPFGYGLGYTTFAYSDLDVAEGGIGRDVLWTVSCDVTNVGKREGSEVVQLYVRDLFSSVVTYDSVLRGFEKVRLKAGESKRVTFTLSRSDLMILDRDMKWVTEPGEFEIRVGSSCEDVRLREVVRLAPPGTGRTERPWLVVNEDNDHYFKNPSELMTEKALRDYLDYTCRGKVTHFFMCPSGQRANFDSKTWEPIWKGANEPDRFGRTNNLWCVNAKLLYDRGIDPYAVWTKRCRERGVSPWLSMRMNDVHFSHVTNYFRNTTFCRMRKDLWVNPAGKGWADASLDYAQPEVRGYVLAHLREIAGRWDVDGVELDWMRFGRHLRPDHERSDAHCLDDFVRQARQALDEVGARRGCRLSLGVRVCRDPDLAWTKMGMDVAGWAREGLIDLVVPHSFYRTDSGIAVAKWIARIGAANPKVRVVPGIDSLAFVDGKDVWMTPEMYRGVAAKFWREGAQGIYLFNLPYLGKFQTDGKRFDYDVADVIFREGLDPVAIDGRKRTEVVEYHDF